jgi:hypothetical protein
MIGRGSRKLPNKDMFTVIDLGNNAARFGLWRACELATYLQITRILFRKLTDDTEIELYFKYSMPLDLRAKFSKTAEVTFDVDEEQLIIAQNLRSKVVLDKSLEQHSSMWIIQKRYSKRNHYLENLTKISNAELNAILNV